jgi:acetyl-CoA carboxylase biotin carboxyl carrier protein
MSTAQTEPAGSEVPESATFRAVQEIIRTFQGSGWTGMTLDVSGLRITLGKHGRPAGPVGGPNAATAAPAAADPAAAAPAAAAPAAAAPGAAPLTAAPASSAAARTSPAPPAEAPPSTSVDTTGCIGVRSPAVGAFWVAPSPGQPPFVQVGQQVAQDEQLAIVEVMKLMNPVVATTAGEVVQICAANAEMVEYEQVLFWIRPTDG